MRPLAPSSCHLPSTDGSCCSLAELKFMFPWATLWPLRALCVTQAGHRYCCVIPMCPCHLGRVPSGAGPSLGGTELPQQSGYLSVGWALCEPGRGEAQNTHV